MCERQRWPGRLQGIVISRVFPPAAPHPSHPRLRLDSPGRAVLAALIRRPSRRLQVHRLVTPGTVRRRQ